MAFESPMEDLSRNGTNTNTSSFLAQLYRSYWPESPSQQHENSSHVTCL